ncbi:MAG: hypothetical protein WA919_20325 [Coleofasciculaceae cyanobacterium]
MLFAPSHGVNDCRLIMGTLACPLSVSPHFTRFADKLGQSSLSDRLQATLKTEQKLALYEYRTRT